MTFPGWDSGQKPPEEPGQWPTYGAVPPPAPQYPQSPGYPPPVPGYPPPVPGYPPPAPGYYPPQYPPPAPQFGAYPPATPVTNPLAIASLVAAGVGVPFGFFCAIGLVLSIAGIVLGIVALNQIKTSGQGGKGLAIAGIAVGGVTMVIYVVGAIVWGTWMSNF